MAGREDQEKVRSRKEGFAGQPMRNESVSLPASICPVTMAEGTN